MGETRFLYDPPTADQLEGRQRIRDRIERLSVRSLRDSGLISSNDIRRLHVGITSGLLFTLGMLALAVATYILLN